MMALLSWEQYNRFVAAFKGAGAVVLLLAACLQPGVASELSIESGPGSALDFHWQSLSLTYAPSSKVRPVGRWQLQITALQSRSMGALGDLSVECSDGGLTQGSPRCDAGQLTWTGNPAGIDFSPQFSLVPDQSGLSVHLHGPGFRIDSRLPADDETLSARLELDESFEGNLELSEEWLAGLGLRELTGAVSGLVEYDQEGLRARLEVRDAEFDSIDGSLAGAGLMMEVVAALNPGESGWRFELDLAQQAGELLLGSVYLPPPDGVISLSLAGEFAPQANLMIESMRLQDPEALELWGSMEVRSDEDGWALHSLRLDEFDLQLPAGYDRWADGPLSAMNLGGLETAGRFSGQIEWRKDSEMQFHGQARGMHVSDPAERFSIDGLDVSLQRMDHRARLEASWASLAFYGLPLGGGELEVNEQEGGYSIARPVTLPLLDGGVTIEQLAWTSGDDGQLEVALDARIDPIDLAALTRLLDFPEFGGQLSGRFPGVVYADERLSFTGGIDIQAFSGQILLSDLSVERPFGSLPALAAQVEFERLDLGELTGAFNFGHMEGQLSGWMRNLRLLNWRPVAMDTRVFTHEDVRRRRISQRAVNNLSSLGGSPGAALLSGTVLRVFDEFPYRRAGLACRLANNICHIDGVAPHDSGGFYILEGRSLPRLDIIGHRRLVDWPQLIGQLEAMMEQ